MFLIGQVGEFCGNALCKITENVKKLSFLASGCCCGFGEESI